MIESFEDRFLLNRIVRRYKINNAKARQLPEQIRFLLN